MELFEIQDFLQTEQPPPAVGLSVQLEGQCTMWHRK